MTRLPRRLRHARPVPMTGLLLVLFAGPAAAADFQVENIKVDLGKFSIIIPKIEVKGTPLDREAFLALFKTDSSESAWKRVLRLNATELSAPSLVMEQTIGSQKQVTVYKDVRLSDIREGRIARGESSGGTIKVDDPETGPMNGEMQRLSVDLFDLNHLVRVLSDKAEPGTTPEMKAVYGRIEQDGYTLDYGKRGKMTLGKSVFRDFKAKLGAEPLMELFARVAEMSEEKAKKDPDVKEDPKVKREHDKRAIAATLGIFEAFDLGSGEMRDSTLSFVDPSKKGGNPEPVELRMSRISYGQDTPEKSGFALEGLQFAASGSKGSLELMSYSGFSFSPVFEQLRATLAKPDADMAIDDFDWRAMVPQIGTVRLSGLQADVPQDKPKGDKSGGKSAQPLRVGLGSFELKSGPQINGIPTALTLILDKLTVPVVERPDAPAMKDLLAMGYRALDLSAKADLAWQEADKQLAIRALSIAGVDMGQLDIAGMLGNVSKELFSSDAALAQVAMLGATAKSVDIKLRNLGLVEKLIENEARKSRRKAEDVRKEYAMMATLGLAAILGPSEGAKSLTAAVSRFVARPGSLSVSATSRAPGGLGLADVVTLSEPTEVFEKIDVKASAE